MKWSLYNFIIRNDSNYLLYNSLTNELMACVGAINSLLNEYKNNIDELKQIHPELYNYLDAQKFIVSDETNEAKQFIEHQKATDTSNDSLRIIINPTLDCNLRCWYCYEKHREGSIIHNDVDLAIKTFIKKEIEDKNLKSLSLSFFGGEPLMHFREQVLPLILYTKELCITHKVKLKCSFTTNAVLLTPNITELLVNTKLEYHFQVPFDGDRNFHDSIKKHPNGTGTYDTVLQNVKYAASKGFAFTIRCNYTDKNILSFKKAIDDLSNIDSKENLVFSLQRIWQEEDSSELDNKEKEMLLYLRNKGLTKPTEYKGIFQCYADKENCIVINYNGDIYKCTANDFLPEKKEGILNSNGVITYNSLYEKRMKAKYALKPCLECNILPICMICTQKRLKMINEEKCIYIKEKDKPDIIRDHIRRIYKETDIT